jgi:hypothetical protein
MHEIRNRAAPIDYERYRAEAARLGSEAIADAFRRLGRLIVGRRHADRLYDGRFVPAGCGQ